jgi:hypothetical protein
MVEALKRYQPIEGRERPIPIESSAQRRATSRSSSYSRDHDSGRGSANDYRSESRANNGGFDQGYLSPTGYRTAFEARQTDGGGLRHEARREQFREEVRRGGSQQAIPIPVPLSPIRTESRQSGRYEK